MGCTLSSLDCLEKTEYTHPGIPEDAVTGREEGGRAPAPRYLPLSQLEEMTINI